MDEGYCVYGAGVITRQVQALQQEMPGVRENQDIEAVHRMRVASRRLRAALPLFKECFPTKKYRAWLKQIRALTSALGAARDCDVQLETLRQFYETLPLVIYQPGIRRLMLRLRQRRIRLQRNVLRDLRQLEASHTLEGLTARLEPLSARQNQIYLYTPYIYQRAFNAIAAQREQFLKYEQYVEQPECIDELHAMRIAAKKLRYTMEIFAPIYPGELKEYLQAARKVQEALGNLHDCDVWNLFLPEFIEKENHRTQMYFGHTRPMRRLEPGLRFFQQAQQENRGRLYAGFVEFWHELKARDVWGRLLEAIQVPYHEAAPEPVPGASQGESQGAGSSV